MTCDAAFSMFFIMLRLTNPEMLSEGGGAGPKGGGLIPKIGEKIDYNHKFGGKFPLQQQTFISA